MNHGTSKYEKQIAELEARANKLPRGSMFKKTVNGHEIVFHRCYERKKRIEEYRGELK